MGRSVLVSINRIAREMERSARAQAREQERRLREIDRETKIRLKADKQHYLADRIALAESENQELDAKIYALENLLLSSLRRDPSINFSKQLKHPQIEELDDIADLKLPPKPNFEAPTPPNFLLKLFPYFKNRYANALDQLEQNRVAYLAMYNDVVHRRDKAFSWLQETAETHNQKIKAFQAALIANEPSAIIEYFRTVLSESEYPDGFPSHTKIAYLPTDKQLIVDCQIPTIEAVIPIVSKYKYVKSNDEITQLKRPERERQNLYTSIVAQLILRYLYELFTADRNAQIDIMVINAFVITSDPSTGRSIQPYLVSLRSSRETFQELDLHNVEPISCLKRLSALISRNPAELVAVRPIFDINMADPRFITEQDVLSEMDDRANLMELTPSEFESLITNLFQKMGLDTKLTQASRDGGVDCVAFDPRPVLGGKVIVQAKRYKNTVGVSAVRDLFGTVHNEGASKGILVTTSSYGKAAYDFANGKPLELLTGSNLLYLLKEHAGIEAKIEMPPDWQDEN